MYMSNTVHVYIHMRALKIHVPLFIHVLNGFCTPCITYVQTKSNSHWDVLFCVHMVCHRPNWFPVDQFIYAWAIWQLNIDWLQGYKIHPKWLAQKKGPKSMNELIPVEIHWSVRLLNVLQVETQEEPSACDFFHKTEVNFFDQLLKGRMHVQFLVLLAKTTCIEYFFIPSQLDWI